MAGCSAKHVVLGLVIERAGYGYDLQQRLDGRFAFLGFSERVVYRALDSLENDGLIAEVGEKRAGRTRRGAPKKLYAATSAGLDELGRWIGEPCELSTVREEIHVKLVLAQAPNFERLLEVIDRLEQSCLSLLHEMQQSEPPSLDELADPDRSWDTVSLVLVDDAEAIRLQGIVEWLHHVRPVVRRRMERLRQRPVRGLARS